MSKPQMRPTAHIDPVDSGNPPVDPAAGPSSFHERYWAKLPEKERAALTVPKTPKPQEAPTASVSSGTEETKKPPTFPYIALGVVGIVILYILLRK